MMNIRHSSKEVGSIIKRQVKMKNYSLVLPGMTPNMIRLTHGIGEMILARTFSEEHKGVFDTIDESGNLVLKLKNSTQVIQAGDIYFEEFQCF